MVNKGKCFYDFGPFRVDPDRRLLLRENRPVPVQPKAFDILQVLVQHSDTVVSKEDLLKAVWPDTFVEESNLAQNIFVLRKTLGDAVGANRYIVTVPGRGYRFAEKVTETPLAPPVHSASDETLILQSQTLQRVTVTESARHRRFLPIGVALLVMVGSLVGYRAYRSSHKAQPIPAATSRVPARRSVAVLGFRDLSGRPEDAWLSTALAEMLNTELAAGEKLRLVPGEDVARTKLDLLLPDAESLSRETLARIRKSLGSDMVVLGTYASLSGKSKGNIRLDLRVQDAVAGETIAEVATTGTEDDLFDLVSRAGMQLREKLGLGAVSMSEAVSVKASLPANPEAARLYAEGLAKLRVFDALTARDLLQRAIAADPKYPLSHVALSDAWSALGYDKKAKEEAKFAFQLASNLSREDKLVVEGSYRMANHEYDQAIGVFRTVFTLFPDNLDHGLRLAEAQYQGSKPDDALSTLAELQKLPPPVADDPRIALQEAKTRMSKSDYQHAAGPLQQAVQKGREQGSRLLVANALRQQCRNDSYLGQVTDGIAACRESRDTYSAAGDRTGEAKALRTWATVVMQSDSPGSIDLDRQALEIFRAVGDEADLAAAMNTLGLLYLDKGDTASSEKMHRDALAIYRRIGDSASVGAVTSNLANDRLTQGDISGAAKLYEQALVLDRQAGDLGGAAVAGYNKANILELRGDLVAAKSGFEDSLKQWKLDGDQYDSGFALYSIGEVSLAQGDFSAARQVLEESLAIRKAAGDKITIAETQLLLANVALEEGRSLSDDEAVARQVIDVFQKEKSADDEAQAWNILSLVLFKERKFDEARQTSARALALARKSKNVQLRMENEILAARVPGLAPESTPAARGAASKQLASVAVESKKREYLGVELEARLAIAEIEMRGDAKAAAESHLASLEKDSRANGFALIAQQASAARNDKK